MFRKIFIVSLASAISFSALSQEKATLDEVLDGFDEAQNGIITLSADFVQVKTLMLLEEPAESNGHFYFKKPDKFLWEYTEPSVSFLALNGESLTSYYPELKSAEQINIKRYKKRLMKYLGIGQSAEVLKDIFDIDLVEDGSVLNSYLLVLDPTKKRVEKRLQLIRMWVDRNSFLPVQAEYTEGNGDITMFTFSEIETDTEIEDEIFSIDIPEGVEINHSSDNLFPG